MNAVEGEESVNLNDAYRKLMKFLVKDRRCKWTGQTLAGLANVVRVPQEDLDAAIVLFFRRGYISLIKWMEDKGFTYLDPANEADHSVLYDKGDFRIKATDEGRAWFENNSEEAEVSRGRIGFK